VLILGLAACGQDDDRGGAAQTAKRTPRPTPPVGRVDNFGHKIDPAAVRLARKVYAAAEQGSYEQLRRLCRPCKDPDYAASQMKLWTSGGTMDELLAVLHTHPAATDGYTYPGFSFAGFNSDFDVADAKALDAPIPKTGYGPPKGYTGLRTSFEDPYANGTGHYTWNGITPVE
jgi:hypothetical protein